MNLNEGLTKIIKEYPSIREYANIKEKKKKGLIDQEMENKKKEYSNFLGEFRESIQELVLKNTNMPAVLVELAFISNEDDEKILRNNQDDFARAIARGVTDYL